MDIVKQKKNLFIGIKTTVRITAVTMISCCLLYPLAIFGLGRALVPYSADGSLVRNDRGEVVGSELIAQGFSRPGYFRARPSAVDYNAAGAGGSNWSPANPELRERVTDRLIRLEAVPGRPVPADLITASGSGLDPHITLAAAMYQAERVASARDLSLKAVTDLLIKHVRRPGGIFTSEPLVNVLIVNMALDRMQHE